jgi:hypothetical protein
MSGSNYLNLSALKFSTDFQQLRSISERSKCPNCSFMRKFYCYDCAVAIAHDPPRPSHPLPLRVIIIRHNSEKPSKSSIIPLKVAYPDDVELYTFTQPDRFDKSEKTGTISPQFSPSINWNKAAILFPGDDAKCIGELPESVWPNFLGEGSEFQNDHCLESVTTIVVIDSTWSTALQAIEKTPELKSVPYMIKLSSSNETIFWRHQRMGRECLATCEAVYVFFRELWDTVNCGSSYDGRFDDILFYYVYIHTVVNDHYRTTKRHRGHLPSYALTSD